MLQEMNPHSHNSPEEICKQDHADARWTMIDCIYIAQDPQAFQSEISYTVCLAQGVQVTKELLPPGPTIIYIKG